MGTMVREAAWGGDEAGAAVGPPPRGRYGLKRRADRDELPEQLELEDEPPPEPEELELEPPPEELDELNDELDDDVRQEDLSDLVTDSEPRAATPFKSLDGRSDICTLCPPRKQGAYQVLGSGLYGTGAASGRSGQGRPPSSTATSTTSASVTLRRSPWPWPQRSTSTVTLTVTDVRPTRRVSP